MSKTPASQITKKITPVNTSAATIVNTAVSVNKATVLAIPCLVDGVGDQVEEVLVQGV